MPLCWRALLLQTYDRASDAEAKQRADCIRLALGIEVEDRPFAKSTLQRSVLV